RDKSIRRMTQPPILHFSHGSKRGRICLETGPKLLFGVALRLLRAQAIPVFYALQDLAFEAPLDRLIEALAGHSVREIILPREALGGAVIVVISFAISEVLHQPRRRIED